DSESTTKARKPTGSPFTHLSRCRAFAAHLSFGSREARQAAKARFRERLHLPQSSHWRLLLLAPLRLGVSLPLNQPRKRDNAKDCQAGFHAAVPIAGFAALRETRRPPVARLRAALWNRHLADRK